MITGFQLDIRSVELKTHLQNKASYHKNKADSYKRQLKGIQSLMDDEPDQSGQTVNPKTGILSSFKSHDGKAQFFQFCADHVVPDETYRVTHQDLVTLEFIERFY